MKEKVKIALEARGIVGDVLLDSLDIMEEVLRVGGNVSEDGFAELYHATTEENKDRIFSGMSMYGKEDGIFFSTKKNGQIVGYGEAILRIYVPLEKMILDDEFDDEIHYKVKVVPYKKVGITIEV